MAEDQKLIADARVTAYRLAGFDGPEPMSADTVSEMLTALADRLEASLEREGWKMVPVEPTREMIAAAEAALTNWRKTLDPDEAMVRSYVAHDRRFKASASPEEKHVIRYASMLSAAPSPEGK